MPLDVLEGEDEARLAFSGAARAGGGAGDARCDRRGRGVDRDRRRGARGAASSQAESVPVGSSVLADRHLRSDPPSDAELEAVRDEVARAFERFDAPPVDHAVAVRRQRQLAAAPRGGSARARASSPGRSTRSAPSRPERSRHASGWTRFGCGFSLPGCSSSLNWHAARASRCEFVKAVCGRGSSWR